MFYYVFEIEGMRSACNLCYVCCLILNLDSFQANAIKPKTLFYFKFDIMRSQCPPLLFDIKVNV